jgi:uncharacterized BrkB/YihY/UPF0761 family membrane protein
MMEEVGRRSGMKSRIAIWAVSGMLVVLFWTLYIMATRQHPLGPGSVGRALIYLTCPIALASHRAQSIYLVLIANAATYALAGAVVETIRRHYKSARF